jgi:chromate transporter
MCVIERRWIDEQEFEDAIATTNLLPGPASTQLAIYCAWRLRGPIGAVIGGFCFIVPGLILILGLSALFLARHPPRWVLGAAAGAGAAVPAVALGAAWGLVGASFRRVGSRTSERARWFAYAACGAAAAMSIGSLLVLVLFAAGCCEIAIRKERGGDRSVSMKTLLFGLVTPSGTGLGPLAWVALKVGALSYGGGFVIVPLMQHDAVSTYHWMSGAQFLNAVALGQITPGPVVQTVAVIGYAARGLTGGLIASVIAFAPSFLFVLAGGPRFAGIRANLTVQAFLTGAGPAVVGAIAGSSVPLALALGHWWQALVVAGALCWLFVARRDVLSCLLLAGAVGVVLALALAGVAV